MEGVMFHHAGDSSFSCIATCGHINFYTCQLDLCDFIWEVWITHTDTHSRRQILGVCLSVIKCVCASMWGCQCEAALSGIGHLAADTSQQVPDFLEERRLVQSRGIRGPVQVVWMWKMWKIMAFSHLCGWNICTYSYMNSSRRWAESEKC